MKVQELLQLVCNDELYLQWKKQHPHTYLTHFFCQIDGQYQPKANWEIGFFDKDTKKITVFCILPSQSCEIKPADDVFQKEAQDIPQLHIDKISIDLDRAKELCAEQFKTAFPTEKTGDGFIILQALEGKQVWNVTFITVTLKFVNVKVDAQSGTLVGQQSITLVQK